MLLAPFVKKHDYPCSSLPRCGLSTYLSPCLPVLLSSYLSSLLASPMLASQLDSLLASLLASPRLARLLASLCLPLSSCLSLLAPHLLHSLLDLPACYTHSCLLLCHLHASLSSCTPACFSLLASPLCLPHCLPLCLQLTLLCLPLQHMPVCCLPLLDSLPASPPFAPLCLPLCDPRCSPLFDPLSVRPLSVLLCAPLPVLPSLCAPLSLCSPLYDPMCSPLCTSLCRQCGMSAHTMPKWIQRKYRRDGFPLIANAEFRMDPATGRVGVFSTKNLEVGGHPLMITNSPLADVFVLQRSLPADYMQGHVLPTRPTRDEYESDEEEEEQPDPILPRSEEQPPLCAPL